MSRIRSYNPYHVKGWTGEIEVSREETVACAVASATPILSADPTRLWILLAYSSGAGQVWFWPYAQNGPYGITTAGGGQSILIHNASYPSLVQMPWFGFAQGAITNVRVITGTTVAGGI